MNKEQLTKKLNEKFAEELTYEPKFEIEGINAVYPFNDYEVVYMRWAYTRIKHSELKVIAEVTGDNPWVDLQQDHLEIIFTIEKAQN